ncbi:MAG: SRPBCC family protein [Pseudomonadota bacterium]
MSIKTIAGWSAGAVAIAVAGTFLLPREVHVERTATIAAAPQAILELAASNTGYQAFNPYHDFDPELKIAPFGPASGVGSGFAFDSKDGAGTQTVAAVSAQQVTYALDLGPLGQPMQAIEALPVEGGTQVTWSMDADMGFNPLFRVMGLFMDDMMGATFEQGLSNLEEAV